VSPAGCTETDVTTEIGPLHVRVWRGVGATDRPALVCLHGLTDSGEIYETLWEALDRRWTVIAPDLPGHGGSPWTPARTYDLVSPAEGVAEVLDQLPALAGGARHCVVLGHSLGVLTAAHTAARRPDLVRHLLLEEPPRKPWPPRYFQRKEQVWLDRLQAMDHESRVAMPLDNHGWTREDLETWSASKDNIDRRMFDVPLDLGENLTRVLARVPCPTTLVLGQRHLGSINRPRRVAALVKASAGGGRALRLDGGHNPRRDARDAFTGVVKQVLIKSVA
jgi:pimeloyl-ACP methyl ester carboxylesterase